MTGSALFGLVAFFAMFAAAAWLLRWLQRHAGGRFRTVLGRDRNIRVLARYPLAWQCTLMVVDLAGKQFAVTVSRRHGVTLLGEVSLPAAPPPRPADPGVATALRHAIAHYGDRH